MNKKKRGWKGEEKRDTKLYFGRGEQSYDGKVG